MFSERSALVSCVRANTEAPDTPFTFSAPWVARAYGIEERVVRAGKRALERRGLLSKVGTCPIAGRGRAADRWLARSRWP